MQAIQIISQDLFDKIRSRFQNLEMGSDNGGVTIDPAEAKFFDFDFVIEEQNLGRVSISLNDPGSLKIYYSQGITENQDEPVKKYWYNFLKEMRLFAMRRLLRFDTRDIAKSNLDKNDFQFLAKDKPKDETAMNTMNESRWNRKNTKKTSRAIKGRTEVIVRHKQSMEEMIPAKRSDPGMIERIFVQNREGERWKCPLNDLGLAFGIAQHVDHGGVPYDPIGKKIIVMAQEAAQLRQFIKHLKPSTLNNDPLGIREKAVGRLQALRTTLESLGKRRYYESWAAEQVELDDEQIVELDDVTVESYKQALTQTNFNEALTEFFPLIHKLMRESNKVNLEDYVGSDDSENKEVDETIDDKKEGFAKFEQWAEAVETGRLDMDQIEKNLNGESLTDKLNSIYLGPNGNLAWAELSNIFGLDERDTDDKALKDQLSAKADSADQNETGPESPVLDVFKSWVEDTFPEWKQDLPELFASQQLTPEPETGMQPVDKPAQGVNPNLTPSPETGMNPAPKPGTVQEEVNQNDWVKETAELIKSRFNLANETVGPFNGEEGILIDVKKEISEKYGEEIGERARLVAEKYMEKLKEKWEMTHHKSVEELSRGDDELSRVKELLGNVKAKVENLTKNSTEEGMLDKVKAFGKKVLDKVAPDDETLLKKLQKDVGVPQTGKPPEKKQEEMESILKLAGLIK